MPLPNLPAKPISVVTLADSVYDTLLNSILSGELVAGSDLSVAAMAKTLQVSRTPVHEALRLLARDGLVTQAVNKFSRVVLFTPDDIREIFEMRWLLEGRAAFLAAAYLPVEVIDRLQCCADKLDDDIDADDWLIRWTSFDDDFHISIAAGAQRPRLLADVRRYRLLHRSFRHRFRDAKALRAALVQHDRILKALRQRNANEAQQAMQDHVGAWSEHFANLVEQPGSES